MYSFGVLSFASCNQVVNLKNNKLESTAAKVNAIKEKRVREFRRLERLRAEATGEDVCVCCSLHILSHN